MSTKKAKVNNRYPFPMLKAAEIVEYFHMISFPIVETDVTKPTSEKVMEIFCALAHGLMNIDYGRLVYSPEHEQDIVDAISDLVHTHEVHVEDFEAEIFFRQIKKMMDYIHYPEFCIQDLTQPQPARIRTIFSALVNFLKFHGEYQNDFEALELESQEKNKKRAELASALDSMNEQINSINLQREEEAPTVEKLRETVSELAAELKELKTIGDGINNQMTKMKQEKANLQQFVEDNKELAENLKKDCERIRGRIVRNPEQLKMALLEMSDNLSSLKRSVADLERHEREMTLKSESLDVVEQDLMSGYSLLAECEVEFKKMEAAEQSEAKSKDDLERSKSELRSLVTREQQLKRQLVNAEEKLNRLNQTSEQKNGTLEKKLGQLRGDWDVVGAEHKTLQLELARHEETINETRSKIQKLKQQHEADVQHITSDFSKLKESVLTYMSDLRQTMGVSVM